MEQQLSRWSCGLAGKPVAQLVLLQLNWWSSSSAGGTITGGLCSSVGAAAGGAAAQQVALQLGWCSCSWQSYSLVDAPAVGVEATGGAVAQLLQRLKQLQLTSVVVGQLKHTYLIVAQLLQRLKQLQLTSVVQVS